MEVGKWEIGIKSQYIAGLFLIALLTPVLFLIGENEVILVEQDTQKEEQQIINNIDRKTGISRNDSVSSRNYFSGKWVFDDVSFPLYKEGNCSFMLSDYACEKYGRKDLKYQNWRWQPHHCDLPRFNGSAFLEKIRGKRVVFVGDSLNKNQWTSMLCLIESSLHQSTPKEVVRNDNLSVFQITGYNATIEYYWSPLLVESNCDDPIAHGVKDRFVKITSIEKHAKHWTDSDILIFDSFMWWLTPNMTIILGNATYERGETTLHRYEMALNTWSDWLEININRTKTKLFFMSLSPYHAYGERWDEKISCYNVTEPILKEDYWGIAADVNMMHIAESAIEKLRKIGIKAEYLNITHLSDYRRDGHPSIYKKFYFTPNEKQLLDPKSYSDCLHWCLPGVPDVWNQILFSYIIKFS